MSAGQRTYLLNRSDGKAGDLNNNVENLTSDEFQSDIGKEQKNEESDDYDSQDVNFSRQSEQYDEEPVITRKTKSKVKRIKKRKQQSEVSTIESRLQNLTKRLHDGTKRS